MDTCYIFCAGGFETLAEPIGNGDYVLAADSGLKHLQALGIRPDGIIGDFDSLGYVPEGAQVFPVKKDDTDSMLAVRRGLALGYLDHAIANLQTLCFLAEHGAQGYLVGLTTIAAAVREQTLAFPETWTGTLSLFCFGRDSTVTLRGLQYELEKGVLTSRFPLGVSNHFVDKAATVTVHEGCVVALYDVENGFPEW